MGIAGSPMFRSAKISSQLDSSSAGSDAQVNLPLGHSEVRGNLLHCSGKLLGTKNPRIKPMKPSIATGFFQELRGWNLELHCFFMAFLLVFPYDSVIKQQKHKPSVADRLRWLGPTPQATKAHIFGTLSSQSFWCFNLVHGFLGQPCSIQLLPMIIF